VTARETLPIVKTLLQGLLESLLIQAAETAIRWHIR